MGDQERLRRWRLVLGRYAAQVLGAAAPGTDSELDQALGYLYDREYAARGHRHQSGSGGSGASRLVGITWLNRTRKLFPKSTFERLQTEALEEYGLTEVLEDPEAAAAIEPSPDLAATLLTVRGGLNTELEAGIRVIIDKVVQEVVARLKTVFAQAFSGRRNRFRRSPQARAQNLDWRGTIHANLRRYDAENQRLAVSELRFNSRLRRRLQWDVILCVDQSASMASSVLYSAVTASILAALPGVTVRLVLFDTSVVDMSHQASDPVTVLMTAQLGGGTDIDRAMRYCEKLVRTPARTVLVLISDMEEGGSVSSLRATVRRLRSAGVKQLGLAALDDSGAAVYDRHVGELLASAGMEIAALTPDRLAEWLAEVME